MSWPVSSLGMKPFGHDARRDSRCATSTATRHSIVSRAVAHDAAAASSRTAASMPSKTRSDRAGRTGRASVPCGGLQEAAAQHRRELSETKPETRIATPMVTANSWNSRPRMPPMNSTGMNTAASESVIETIVKPISREPVERRLHRRLAHLHVPHDVLEHHDGVVDDEADRRASAPSARGCRGCSRAGTSRRTCRRSRSAAPGSG